MLVPFNQQGPLRHHWYAVATSDDVQDKTVALEFLREELVLWRGPSGHVIAAPDRCSHRTSTISAGVVEDGCLVCPHHGRVFGEGGRCIHIATRGVIDDSAHLTTYACEEHHGLVWVCTGNPRTEIPAVAADGDPAFRRANASPSTWTAPAPRIMEALLGQGFTDGPEATFDIPFTYRRSIPTGDGSDTLLLVTCSPIGAVSSLVFPVIWSNGTEDSSEDLLHTEVSAITALKPDVEAVSGMYGIDENAPDDSTDSISAWRRALLEVVSAQV